MKKDVSRTGTRSSPEEEADGIDLGGSVKKLRLKRHRISQFQLAVRANVTVSFIAQLEGNHCGASMKSLESIGKALGVPTSWILLLAAQGDQHDEKINSLLETIQKRILMLVQEE